MSACERSCPSLSPTRFPLSVFSLSTVMYMRRISFLVVSEFANSVDVSTCQCPCPVSWSKFGLEYLMRRCILEVLKHFGVSHGRLRLRPPSLSANTNSFLLLGFYAAVHVCAHGIRTSAQLLLPCDAPVPGHLQRSHAVGSLLCDIRGSERHLVRTTLRYLYARELACVVA